MIAPTRRRPRRYAARSSTCFALELPVRELPRSSLAPSTHGPPIGARGVPAPELTRDYECSNAKLSSTLGFVPRLSVLEAVSHLLEHVDHEDRAKPPTRGRTNIRWLELLTQVKPNSTSSPASCEGAHHRGRRSAGLDLQARLGDSARSFTHAEPDIRTPRRSIGVRRGQARRRLQLRRLHNVDVCERDRRAGRRTSAPSATSPARRAAGAPVDELRLRRPPARKPYGEDDVPAPRSIYALTKLAGEHAALPTATARSWSAGPGCSGLRGSGRKAATSSKNGHACARAGRLKMVADQRLQPTFTADLASALIEAVEERRDGRRPPQRPRARFVGTSSRWRSWRSRVDVPVEPVETTIPPGSPDRPALTACSPDRLPPRSGSLLLPRGARPSPTTWDPAGLSAPR